MGVEGPRPSRSLSESIGKKERKKMKRFTVLVLAVVMIAMVAGSALAVNLQVQPVRGAYNYGSSTAITISSATAAATALSTGSYPYYGNKTFTVYNPTGGGTINLSIEGSADNSHWFTVDGTTLAGIAAGVGKYKAVINTVLPYMRVRAVSAAPGGDAATPECYWFGITN